jgi:hypothetical protein
MTMLFWRKHDHPTEEELSAFLDGELATGRMAAMTDHLRTCEQCAVSLEGLGTAKALVAELPQLQPSRSFMLGAESARPRPLAPARSPLIFAPAVTLTLLLALLAVDLRGVSTEQSTSRLEIADDAAKTMASEPEQRSAPPMPASNAGGAAAQDASPSGTPAAAMPAPAARGAAPDGSPATTPRLPSAAAETAGSAPTPPSAPATGPGPGMAPVPAPAPGERLEQRPFSAPTVPGTAADSAGALPEDVPGGQPATASPARDASDDPGWLRPLQVGAFIAFVASVAAVAWPWLRRKGESSQ